MNQFVCFPTLRRVCVGGLLALGAAVAWADAVPVNEQAMYGEAPKTDAMRRADAAFIETMLGQGLSREGAAKAVVERAWGIWRQGDKATAMRRFNQAWLLDPENSSAYHGFALVVSDRGGEPAEVERLFRLALAKPKAEAAAWVDYGRFLWKQQRLDESTTALTKALEIAPRALNARANLAFVHYLKRDAASACSWGRQAVENGETLEPGFLDDMCRRAGTPQ